MTLLNTDPVVVEATAGGTTTPSFNSKPLFVNSDEANCPGTISVVDANGADYTGAVTVDADGVVAVDEATYDGTELSL